MTQSQDIDTYNQVSSEAKIAHDYALFATLLCALTNLFRLDLNF